MRIMAFDVGEKKIGVALCDSLELTTRPLCIINRNDDSKAVLELISLAKENEVQKVVLGLPLSFDGNEGQASQKIRLFGQMLSAKTDLPIDYFDESGSTKEALGIMLKVKSKRQRQSTEDDAIAAAIILRNYLEIHRING